MEMFLAAIDRILWILVGIIIRWLLDKPIERRVRAINYWLRTLWSRIRGSNIIVAAQDEFRAGKWHIGWVVVEGSSSDPTTPANLICKFDPAPVLLPPDRQEKKEKIEEEQAETERRTGKRDFHAGPVAALAKIGRGQIGSSEEPLIVLHFRQTDYYTFMATGLSLDDPVQDEHGTTVTVRQKYLSSLNYRLPFAEFATAVSVNLSLITSNGKIVLARRAEEGMGGYAGYLAPPINEVINPVLDRDANGTLSLFATAKRGANWELGIEITEDELLFFTVGVDTRMYFYEVTGLIRSKRFTSDDILARRSLGSKERFESTELYFLPNNSESVAQFMRESTRTEKWSPEGAVCVVQTLMHEFGTHRTERALKKYPPVRSQYWI